MTTTYPRIFESNPVHMRDRIIEIDNLIETLKVEREKLISEIEQMGFKVDIPNSEKKVVEWKYGNSARCISSGVLYFTKGGVYKVLGVSKNSYGEVILKMHSRVDETEWRLASLFEHV